MDYASREDTVPQRIKAEPQWRFYACPKTLFLYDLCGRIAES